jgi:hypothetical protein
MAEEQTTTDQDAEDPNRKRGPIAEHPKWKFAVQGIGAVAAVGAIVYLLIPSLFPTKPSSAPEAAGSSSQEAPPTTAPSDATTEGRQTDGTACLADESKEVSCAAQHLLEVIGGPESDCTDAALIAYLSGKVGVDILITSPHRLPAGPYAGSCVTDVPSDAFRTASNAQILASGHAGDPWRRCIDSETSNDRLSCTVLHDGEYMALPSNSTDCVSAFESYTDKPYSQVSDHLRVVRVQPSGGSDQACLASVLGSDALTASIRRLRTSALPLVPR